jgi:hypothetical protein
MAVASQVALSFATGRSWQGLRPCDWYVLHTPVKIPARLSFPQTSPRHRARAGRDGVAVTPMSGDVGSSSAARLSLSRPEARTARATARCLREHCLCCPSCVESAFRIRPGLAGVFVRRRSGNPSRQAARACGISSAVRKRTARRGDCLAAAVFRTREFPPVTPACTAPKPHPKPCGRTSASLKARRLRIAGSTQTGGKGMAAKTNADTNTAELRPAPQRLTQKQVETQSSHPASKGATP